MNIQTGVTEKELKKLGVDRIKQTLRTAGVAKEDVIGKEAAELLKLLRTLRVNLSQDIMRTSATREVTEDNSLYALGNPLSKMGAPHRILVSSFRVSSSPVPRILVSRSSHHRRSLRLLLSHGCVARAADKRNEAIYTDKVTEEDVRWFLEDANQGEGVWSNVSPSSSLQLSPAF